MLEFGKTKIYTEASEEVCINGNGPTEGVLYLDIVNEKYQYPRLCVEIVSDDGNRATVRLKPQEAHKLLDAMIRALSLMQIK